MAWGLIFIGLSFGAFGSQFWLIIHRRSQSKNKTPAWVPPWVRNVIVVVGFAISVFAIMNERLEELDADGNPIGLLSPQNRNLPQSTIELLTRAHQSTNGTFAILGGFVVRLRYPMAVPLIQFENTNGQRTDLLTLFSTGSKAYISGDFFDKNGDLVATIRTNRFIINRNRYFCKRCAGGVFTIQDNQGEELLNLEFLNSNAFEITGKFRFPNGKELLVTKTNSTIDTMTFADELLSELSVVRVKANGRISWYNAVH
jgi:hypothetical protein